MAKKPASKKSVPQKAKSVSKVASSKGGASRTSSASKASAKKSPSKGVKVVSKVSQKKSPQKPVVKASLPKQKKTISNSNKKVAKPVSKVVSKKSAQPKKSVKTFSNAKKVDTKKASSKSVSREMKLRAQINAKAAPKKAIPQKKSSGAVVKKTESKVKKQNTITKPAPKKSVQTKTPAKATKKEAPKSAKSVSKKSDAKKSSSSKKNVEVAPTKAGKATKVKVESNASKKGTPAVVEPIIEKRSESTEPLPQRPKGKFRVRPSHNIYFSIEDLNSYLERRDTSIAVPSHAEKSVSKTKAVVSQASTKPIVTPVPRPPLAVATVFDILGLNPVVAKTHAKLEEQDVPRKWKKYYKLLMDLRKHHSSGVEMRAEEVMKRSAKDDAGDLSSYGQHLADAGSESFERDMAYNIISNQKEILSEIDEAIKRMKNGTYGVCEITGKPIPESRLLSIPYTRCTKEGQEIKEAEMKRQKASQRMSIYDMSDGTQSGTPSDDDSA